LHKIDEKDPNKNKIENYINIEIKMNKNFINQAKLEEEINKSKLVIEDLEDFLYYIKKF
jgi:hypothetical protein